MLGHDWSDCVTLAYMGLGSGLELVPYFAALVSLVGAALIAVVQWPVLIAVRWLKARRKSATVESAQPRGELDNDEPAPNEARS